MNSLSSTARTVNPDNSGGKSAPLPKLYLGYFDADGTLTSVSEYDDPRETAQRIYAEYWPERKVTLRPITAEEAATCPPPPPREPTEFSIQQDEMKRRVKSIPNQLLPHIDTFSVLPMLSSAELRRRARLARALTQATGGGVQVIYQPSASMEGDEGGMGFLFNARITEPEIGSDVAEMWLDGRDEDLHSQLVAELNRVAKHYRKLAKLVAAAAPEKGGSHA